MGPRFVGRTLAPSTTNEFWTLRRVPGAVQGTMQAMKVAIERLKAEMRRITEPEMSLNQTWKFKIVYPEPWPRLFTVGIIPH